MPTPTQVVNQRPDLAAFVDFDLQYNMMGFIGYQVLPIMDVALQAHTFGRVPREELAKLFDTARTSSGGYNRVVRRFKDESYVTSEHGLEGPADRRNRAMYANVIDGLRYQTETTTHDVLAAAEKRVADAVFNATTWTPTAVTTEWSNPAATPITDVKAASQRVRDRVGQYANALIINRRVKRNLQECTQIHDRLAAQGAGFPLRSTDITNEQLAQLFDIDMVIVADSSYDAAASGQPTTTLSDIWDAEYAMVAKICRSNNMEEIGIGRTFHWTGDGSTAGGTVETYYEEAVRGDIVRVRHETDEKVIYPEAGDLLSNITA